MDMEHYFTGRTNDVYKSECSCGKWFMVLDAHLECANKGCHEQQYHDDYVKRWREAREASQNS